MAKCTGAVKRRRDAGFTLVELLVVMAIIGVLATIAITSFSSGRKQAYYATMKSDLHSLIALQEDFWESRMSHRNGPTYASLNQLRNQLAFSPSANVTINVRRSATGWAARARHSSLDRRDQCTIYVGTNVTPFPPATAPGLIECR